ncbi:bifunctional diaminohydroxyphosphoribosylaminopyrimidine deaminase/5-amino-6-(5-phosphoribosylamino)uracil reductase RibD [Persicimonas caeni]|nr:bifunctional diaminohydroxyphosphoribosylaminopyrimidine deaminase/5-amino-6-(5-phosphoribosylamino)uracil reductase RibD [Persicimonas caeni]
MSSESHANRHERLMAEAIAEAKKAEGRTRPNPLVGCVIVRDGEVVARGYHARAGEAHGEVAALRALDGSAEGCEAYVNLEPCCHHGRTPPCTEALINAGIRRVYVGTLDPFPEVSGKGIEALRRAGVEVVSGVLEDESRRLNQPYFKRITTGLPWVAVKYAMTLDGKIASSTGDSAWISSEASRRRVHELRNVHDAIMVGTGTLLHDNPRLTCRIDGGRDPVRVVLDATLSAPLDANVFDPALSDARTIAVVGPHAPDERRRALAERGVTFLEVAVDAAGKLDLRQVLRGLADRELPSVFVEGGSQLLGSLFDQKLVDRVYAFVSPKVVGGQNAPSAVAGEGVEAMKDALELERLSIEVVDGRDVFITGDVPASFRADIETTPAASRPVTAEEA